MVAVQLDEAVQAYCNSCIDTRKPVEVGVLIGRATGGKVLILQVAPTPTQDGIPAASLQLGASAGASKGGSTKGSKGKAGGGGGSVDVDKDWVVEHAAQVLGMLPGGLCVAGLYLLCPEGSFTGATPQLLSLLHKAQQELEEVEGFAAGSAAQQQGGLVLLHIDAVTGKLATREFTGGAAGSLKPCELKPASGLLANLVAVHCRLETDLEVQLANPKQRLRDALAVAVDQELQRRVQPAVGLLAGQLLTEDAPLLDLPTTTAVGGAEASPPIPHIQLELLLPPAAAGGPAVLAAGGGDGGLLQRGKGRAECVGVLRVRGVLDCRAYLPKREGAGAAVAAIKEDAARTLRARVDMLAELAEQQQEEAEEAAAAAAAAAGAQAGQQQGGQQQQKPPQPPLLRRAGEAPSLTGVLPRRVFLRGPGGGAFYYSDHLAEGEGPEAAIGRAEDLGVQLGYAASAAEGGDGLVQSLEAMPTERPAGKAGTDGKRGKASASVGSAAYCNVVAVGAAAAAALAVLVGYMSLGQN